MLQTTLDAIEGRTARGVRGKRVLVLGGKGFIGRYIYTLLKDSGADVTVGTRAISNRLSPEERQVRLHELSLNSEWMEALAEADVVVNAVGILRERKGESYEAVHHLAVKSLASVCTALRIKLIHISALGLENDLKDLFSITKKRGEQELIQSKADWHIIRASLVEGDGAYGWTWFKKIAQWPIHFIPEKYGRISPVHVSILAKRVLSIVREDRPVTSIEDRIHEVTNGRNYLLPEYLVVLNKGVKRPQIIIPDWVVQITARLCDKFGLTPLTYGHYELLTYDNCPKKLESK